MKKLIAGCVLIITALVLAGCPQPTEPPKSSEKEMSLFKFEDVPNDALNQDYPGTFNQIQQRFIVGPLPAGTEISALVATFTVSEKATVTVDGVAQTSGVTANDFRTDKTYTVTAEDGSTATYTVHVTRTELGFTSFSVTGTTMPEMALTIDDTATPRTLTGNVRWTYRNEVSNLTATFVHNGTSVSVNSATITSPVASQDLTNPTTYTIHGQGSVAVDYLLTLNVASSASTVNTLSSFSFEVNGVTYPANINNGAGTIVVTLPSTADATNLVATFTRDDDIAAVTIGATPQESGVTSNNFSGTVTYTVTAEDGTAKTYDVTVTVNPTLAIITQACPSWSSVYALGGKTWFDVVIPNKAALGAGWKIYTATYNKVYRHMLDTNLFTNFADGDTIRIVQSSYTGTVNAIGDARPSDGIWVFKSAQDTVLSSYGIAWIENGSGDVLDILAYTSNLNTSNYWLEATTTWYPTASAPDAQTRLSESISDVQWVGSDRLDAASLDDAANTMMHLKDDSVDGNAATDWEAYAPPLLKASWAANPASVKVTASQSGSFLLTCTVSLYGGASNPATVTADLSVITGAGLGMVNLHDDGLDNDATAGDGIYSYYVTMPAGTTAGTYSIPCATTGSANTTSSSISLNVIEYTVLFTTGFEGSVSDITGIVGANSTPTWSDTTGFSASNSTGEITVNFGTYSTYPWILGVGATKTGYIGTGAKYSGLLGLGFNEANQSIRSSVTFTDPGIIKFYAKASGPTSNYTVLLEYSTDGTTWTTFQTLSANGSNTGSVTTTAQLYQYDMSGVASGAYYIRFIMSARTGGSFYLDDFLVAQR